MKVLVIGAGASGLIAAVSAAASGCETLLLEKNEKAGKKIYITGKGRCNLTNACDHDEFLKNVVNGSRFMMSSLKAFGPSDIMDLLERYGCRVKTERGNRVFPVSDHASDVTKALLAACKDTGVQIKLRTEVTGIEKEKETGRFLVRAVSEGKRQTCPCDKVIVCTGGKGYPSTGSTGDGYRFAREAGHTVRECIPSLTSFLTGEETTHLAGVSLKNISLTVKNAEGKCLSSEEGELLFTHRGISGPLVLTASALLNEKIAAGEPLTAVLDLKPALDEKMLDARLLRDFEHSPNGDIGNVLGSLLISGIRQEVLYRSGIPADKKVHDITKTDREALRKNIRELEFHITGTGGFEEAVITRGGVSLKEINPKTMESKRMPGLFFAGEVLDVDAFTGGFNLQLAWSTGYAAGRLF